MTTLEHPDWGAIEDIRARIRCSSDPYEGRVRQITLDQALALQAEWDHMHSPSQN